MIDHPVYPINWTPYTPLKNNLILRPLTYDETITSGGVLLPQTAGVQKAEGVVLAVGPGVEFEIPKHIWDEFYWSIVSNEGFGAAKITRERLRSACAPIPPFYSIGDLVYFPPWLAQWEQHFDTGLEFCRIDANQVLGVIRGATKMYGLNPDINNIEDTIPVEKIVAKLPDNTKAIENADNAVAFHDQRFGEGDDL